MKSAPYFLVLGFGLGSCSQQQSAGPGQPEPAPAETTRPSLTGTWQLKRLESSSFEANGKVPDQRLVFNASQQFQFFGDGKLTAAGTYALGTGSACGGATSTEPLLQVTVATPNAYAPHGNYTLTSSTLVIDGCLAADGPRYSFERVHTN